MSRQGRPEAGKSEKPQPDDLENQGTSRLPHSKTSVYARLGWLDRLLALWILLAIIIGILLGNYVDGIETALQKGKFVQVSVPIGDPNLLFLLSWKRPATYQFPTSCRTATDDVSHLV